MTAVADPYRYFRVEARELVDQLGRKIMDVEKGGGGDDHVGLLLRLAHTLKGAARVVRQPGIADHAHAVEGLIEPFRRGGEIPAENINAVLEHLDRIAADVAALGAPEAAKPAEPSAGAPAPEEGFRTIRTDMAEVDALLNGVSETLAQLTAMRRTAASLEQAAELADVLLGQLSAAKRAASPTSGPRADRAQAVAEELRSILRELGRNLPPGFDHVGRELLEVRNGAERLRLTPVSAVFTSIERTARDAARALGKQVSFEGTGGEVRLDAHVLRTVHEALMQVVRNAVAHGIEAASARAADGKPPAGRVAIRVSTRGRRAVFVCEDDGAGIDVDALRAAATRGGMSTDEAGRLDRDGLLKLLALGGLSTAGSVTEVSGRGIGMDIVRDAVQRLGGKLRIDTQAGRGTRFEISVPLSLAAIDALMVESDGITAAIPLDSVRHTLRLAPGEVLRTADSESIVFDGNVIPFVPLRRLLRESASASDKATSAVIVSGAGSLAAIGIDRLAGTADVTLHRLPEFAPADPMVAGASLNPAGDPQLVFDPDVLVDRAINGSRIVAKAVAARRPILVIDDSLTTRMLEQSILESAGYDVELAASAEEALERIRRKDYALFLVDVEMPGMDGFSFIEHIRADPAVRHIPAILVTSLNSPDHLRRGEAVGAQGYMIKSEFDQAQLLALIGRLAA